MEDGLRASRASPKAAVPGPHNPPEQHTQCGPGADSSQPSAACLSPGRRAPGVPSRPPSLAGARAARRGRRAGSAGLAVGEPPLGRGRAVRARSRLRGAPHRHLALRGRASGGTASTCRPRQPPPGLSGRRRGCARGSGRSGRPPSRPLPRSRTDGRTDAAPRCPAGRGGSWRSGCARACRPVAQVVLGRL